MRIVQELPDRGAAIAPRVAAILGAELGWDEARQAAEVDAVPRRRPARVRGPVIARRPRQPGRRRSILAFDEGTTSARTIAVDRAGAVVAVAQREFEQRYPAPGDVRHDPEAIWDAQIATAREVDRGGRRGGPRRGDRDHEPARDRGRLGPRDRPRRRRRDRLAEPGHGAVLRGAPGGRPRGRSSGRRTGLPIDAYFSGPKIRQILVEDPALRPRAERGELAAGTVESFLIWRLTGGRDPRDRRLERLADAPPRHPPRRLGRRPGRADGGPAGAAARGPELVGGLRRDGSGALRPADPDRRRRPATSRRRRSARPASRPGEAKVTLGTGRVPARQHGRDAGRRRATACSRPSPGGSGRTAPIVYALEGSVFVTGAAVQWLRDGLGLFADIGRRSSALAARVADSGGVVVVPAFVGLGAPYWDPDARGRDPRPDPRQRRGARSPARRSTSIAFQVRDVVEAMDADLGRPLTRAPDRRRRGGRPRLPARRRPARPLGRAAGRPRDDGVRGGGAGRSRGRVLGDAGRDRRAPAGRAAVRAVAPTTRPRRRPTRLEPGVERVRGWAAAGLTEARARRRCVRAIGGIRPRSAKIPLYKSVVSRLDSRAVRPWKRSRQEHT